MHMENTVYTSTIFSWASFMLRKIQISQPGSYDRLKLIETDIPALSPTQVLIVVKACGVNYADSIIRMGLYASAKELHGYPITPGF